MKTPPLLPGKSSPIFPLRFAPARPCFTYGRIKTGQSSTTLQKVEHFPLRSDQPGREVLKIIFAREQKCIVNHSGMGFCAGMVVTNTTFVLEKFLINVFPLKDFLNSLLKFPPGTYRPDRERNPGLPDRHADIYPGSL